MSQTAPLANMLRPGAQSLRPSLPRQACLQGCLPVSRLRSARRRLRSLHAHQADKPATGPATGTAVLSRGRPAPGEAPRLESTRHGAEPRRYIILHTHQKQGRGVGGWHQECPPLRFSQGGPDHSAPPSTLSVLVRPDL